MKIKETRETSKIVRKDVEFDLTFICQDYTMLEGSPNKNLSFHKGGMLNRRGFVGLAL
jgi:hypothetical protein